MALFASLPQLRHMSIQRSNFKSLYISNNMINMLVFFPDIYHNVPNLESLKVSTHLDCPSVDLNNAVDPHAPRSQRLTCGAVSHLFL
jgi:hypothetical protein